nr:biotin-dependent carboxyltransferase family protein [uncultured Gellertiella sp.]
MIEILSTGLSNTVQDRGRRGHLAAGVSRAGAMDGQALEIANRLLGNASDAAGLELAIFPFRLRFHVACRFAIAGAECAAALGSASLPPFWTMEAGAGDELRLAPPRQGARAILAFSGGLDVPLVLGSRATDLKSGWGGFCGRGLERGDRLVLLPPDRAAQAGRLQLPGGWGAEVADLRPTADGDVPVRIMPGAEWDGFTSGSRSQFVDRSWRLTGEANRQGYRLDGPALTLIEKRELFSHGIMPGTVQVPPNGQPIIQMAEANTCGGYPKIAHVIEADLWRLAQMRPGDRLRFLVVSRQEAMEALRFERQWMERLSTHVRLIGS